MIAQGTQEWLDQRAGLITCSRLGAILGLDKYCTPVKYWKELTGKAPEFKGNVATDWGTANEPNAIRSWEIETGEIAWPSGFVKHSTIPFLGGSPDGLVGEDVVLETKCPFTRTIPQEAPPKYVAQVQGLLEVTGRDMGVLFFWTPDETRGFEIKRDREWWAETYPKLEKFWQAVQSKEWKK